MPGYAWRGAARCSGSIWTAPHLTMRDFSDDFLDAYCRSESETLLYTVGVYRIEGPGIQLFEKIEGDHHTIIGLPLLPLLGYLREIGWLATRKVAGAVLEVFRMKRACVVGWPIEHSRSPLIHGYWLKRHGIDGDYVRLPVKPEDAGAFFADLAAPGLRRLQRHRAA